VHCAIATRLNWGASVAETLIYMSVSVSVSESVPMSIVSMSGSVSSKGPHSRGSVLFVSCSNTSGLPVKARVRQKHISVAHVMYTKDPSVIG
jgi:hypothetical protein